MELLILLVIGLLILIFVLPFVAIAKANAAKRDLANLTARLASVENELRNLRPGAATATKPEPGPAPEIAVPPPLPGSVSKAPPEKKEEPPIPAKIVARKPAPPPKLPRPPINWEQFMGAKLFAWIGGLALFLGVAFFVKYSFEHNLIPPAVRLPIRFSLLLPLLFPPSFLHPTPNS